MLIVEMYMHIFVLPPIGMFALLQSIIGPTRGMEATAWNCPTTKILHWGSFKIWCQTRRAWKLLVSCCCSQLNIKSTIVSSGYLWIIPLFHAFLNFCLIFTIIYSYAYVHKLSLRTMQTLTLPITMACFTFVSGNLENGLTWLSMISYPHGTTVLFSCTRMIRQSSGVHC